MRRAWNKICAAAQAELNQRSSSLTGPSRPPAPYLYTLTKSPTHRLRREINAQDPSSSHSPSPGSEGGSAVGRIIDLFIEKLSVPETRADFLGEEESRKILELRDELVRVEDEEEGVINVLEEKARPLVRGSADDGSAVIELLKHLRFWPNLALKVFLWRRNLAEDGVPLTPEEYAKGINAAGKVRNVDLALELFMEATEKGLKRTSTYNALMGAYMFNGMAEKCQAVFQDVKRDADCCPSIVTYNILLSVFGRLMLIDHVEETYQEIQRLNLEPNVGTYNSLIAGYLTAWMWDKMEQTFYQMKAYQIKPDINTHRLMLRGYAHSGNLEKMEETYESVKDHVNENDIPLIRAMVCAYCKSSAMDRVKKVETLLGLIPEDGYRPWLNVLLIRLYAQEDSLEKMEHSINEAFERKICVSTARVMRAIVGSYFRCNALEKLVIFVKRAKGAGWRMCRSIYHGKMVMYGTQKQLAEMENVLDEMESVNMDPTKKTFVIMHYAYLSCGQRHKAEQIKGWMCKQGYHVPLNIVSAWRQHNPPHCVGLLTCQPLGDHSE